MSRRVLAGMISGAAPGGNAPTFVGSFTQSNVDNVARVINLGFSTGLNDSVIYLISCASSFLGLTQLDDNQGGSLGVEWVELFVRAVASGSVRNQAAYYRVNCPAGVSQITVTGDASDNTLRHGIVGITQSQVPTYAVWDQTVNSDTLHHADGTTGMTTANPAFGVTMWTRSTQNVGAIVTPANNFIDLFALTATEVFQRSADGWNSAFSNERASATISTANRQGSGVIVAAEGV